MKLIFAGTPEFAAIALIAVLAANKEVALVLTQPDRPAGRGMKPSVSPVKRVAESYRLPLLQPVTLKDPAVQDALRAVGADVMVVAAYGLILPQAVLDIPKLGALNIHASLLPRWRGAAPIQRALLAGDRETGVCIMHMEAGLDTGPVILRESLPIEPDEDAGSLHDRLAALGARLIVRALDALESGTLVAEPQPLEGLSYAQKLAKSETWIDWADAAVDIERSIRAFFPIPGARTLFKGTEIKLWRAVTRSQDGNSRPRHLPGEVLEVKDGRIAVACGEGVLEVLELQRQGGKRLVASEFIRGFPIVRGDRFLPHARGL